MDFDFKSGNLDAIEHKILLVLATKDGSVINGTSVIEETIKPFVATGEFGKGFGETLYFNETKSLAAKRLLVFNVGKKPKKADLIRRATAKAWKGLRAKGFREILISLDGLEDENHARAAIEGLILGDYQYTDLKSEKDKLPGKLEQVLVHSTDDYEDRVIRWQAICQGTVRARDLSQMPANVLDPAKLAELVTDWAEPCGYKASILEEAECEEIGMRTMLAVGQGSAKDSKFIIMEYEPKKSLRKNNCPGRKSRHLRFGRAFLETGKCHGRNERGYGRWCSRGWHYDRFARRRLPPSSGRFGALRREHALLQRDSAQRCGDLSFRHYGGN